MARLCVSSFEAAAEYTLSTLTAQHRGRCELFCGPLGYLTAFAYSLSHATRITVVFGSTTKCLQTGLLFSTHRVGSTANVDSTTTTPRQDEMQVTIRKVAMLRMTHQYSSPPILSSLVFYCTVVCVSTLLRRLAGYVLESFALA